MSGEVVEADLLPAHEDWCCAKGCAGYGSCAGCAGTEADCNCLVQIVREYVRRALHDAWLDVHIHRFDGDYADAPNGRPDYAEQAVPDNIYNGTLRAERRINDVAIRYGVGYHALRDLRVPLAGSDAARATTVQRARTAPASSIGAAESLTKFDGKCCTVCEHPAIDDESVSVARDGDGDE